MIAKLERPLDSHAPQTEQLYLYDNDDWGEPYEDEGDNQWGDQDSSDPYYDEQETDVEEEEDEDLPFTRILKTFNDEASDDIAFRIGPKKDGIVRMKKGEPLRLNPNPFQPLEEDEGLNANDTQTTQTWKHGGRPEGVNFIAWSFTGLSTR